MDDLRGHLTPKVVHSSPDLPRPGQTSRADARRSRRDGQDGRDGKTMQDRMKQSLHQPTSIPNCRTVEISRSSSDVPPAAWSQPHHALSEQ